MHGRWAELLPLILWSYRTTSRRGTGDTPCGLTYGADAVVPVEQLIPSERVLDFAQDSNDEALALELQFREERRDVALLKSYEFKRRMAAQYDKHVHPRNLREGDLVLRQVDVRGKLDPKWEGPYILGTEVAPGAYKLLNQDREILTKMWNAQRLKKFFV